MKTAFDMPAVRHVAAYVLLYRGKPAGRIVVGFPIGGSGMGAARATVAVHEGPLANLGDGHALHGSASGCGYDKTSGAVASAFASIATKGLPYLRPYVDRDEPKARLTKAEVGRIVRRLAHAGGAGMSVVESLLERLGYTVVGAC